MRLVAVWDPSQNPCTPGPTDQWPEGGTGVLSPAPAPGTSPHTFDLLLFISLHPQWLQHARLYRIRIQ